MEARRHSRVEMVSRREVTCFYARLPRKWFKAILIYQREASTPTEAAHAVVEACEDPKHRQIEDTEETLLLVMILIKHKKNGSRKPFKAK